MSQRDQIQDLVVLFDSTCSAVVQEMSFGDFERLRAGMDVLPARAGEPVRAAYVRVGAGLRVNGLVFFVLPFDAAGRVPDTFNIPLKYLADHAGVRTDLGIGPAHVASRSQCPVPWIAIKLWEPDAVEGGPARLVQRAVVLNRLELRSTPLLEPDVPDHVLSGQASMEHSEVLRPMRPLPAPSFADTPGAARAAAASALPPVPEHRAETEAEAEAPRPARAPAHLEAAPIEQGHLEQIRKIRAEVMELKSALRAERERNRRLQALLRGEV